VTTSGVTALAFTGNDVIAMALRQIGVYSKNEVIDANDLEDATRVLNLLLLSWQNKGLSLSRAQDCYLFLKKGQYRYVLGGAASEHITDRYTKTALAAIAATGAGNVTLTDTTGLTTGDFIGVLMDTGVIHWTTATTQTNPVGLTTPMSGPAASGAAVYFYTTKVSRPLRLLSARRRTPTLTDIPFGDPVAREDYNRMPNKFGTGTPNVVYYDPLRDTYGHLYLWLPPSHEKDILCLTVIRPIELFTSGSQTPDVPAEMYEALTCNLALRLANEYHEVNPEIYAKVQAAATSSLMAASMFDNELAPVKFEPER
jgi:hypothetical protein